VICLRHPTARSLIDRILDKGADAVGTDPITGWDEDGTRMRRFSSAQAGAGGGWTPLG
jgi:hypothetical protein